MTRPIPDEAVSFIASHEGCQLTAYRDGAGILTIGFGSTTAVAPGDRITLDEAKRRLKVDLLTAAAKIDAVVPGVAADLSELQYAALLSFVFNLGLKPSWTIVKRLKARQWDQIPAEMAKFNRARDPATGQTVVVKGLANRRADEQKMWVDGTAHASAATIPSSVTRAVGVTPPTPADPVPPQKSAQMIAGALAVAGTVPAAAKTVVDTLTPWQEAAPIVVHAIQVAGVAGAGAAVTVLVLNWLKKREGRS